MSSIYLTGEISHRVRLMIGVCLNVSVARGLINLLATNDVVGALYEDLAE